MATLGNTTPPASGSIYDDFGSGTHYWTGGFTMPAGGGVVSDVYVYIGGDGTSFTGDLCIWGATALLWHGSITFPSNSRTNGGQQWLHLTVPSLYVAAGTVNIGVWAGGNVVWTQESSGASNRCASASPGSLGSASGTGNGMGAYIVYTPGGAYINTGTDLSPVFTATAAYINTGTELSPIWTPAAGAYINTGTELSPIWTPAG